MALKVKIGADAKSFFREMDKVDKRGTTMGQKMKAAGKMAAIGIGAIAAAATAAAAATGALAIKMIKIGEDANTADDRLSHIVNNMGVFGDSADKVSDRLLKVARAQSMLTAVDNKAIKEAQAKLATFEEVLVTADEMGGIFDRATASLLDLSAAGFGSATESAAKLGKILQDPIRNIESLSRAGIQFTDKEKEKIAALVESGDLLKAQDMILTKIESKMSGVAATTANGMDKIKNAISLVIEDAAKPLARAFEGVSETIMAMGPRITEMMDKIAPKIRAVADMIASSISDAIEGDFEKFKALGKFIGDMMAIGMEAALTSQGAKNMRQLSEMNPARKLPGYRSDVFEKTAEWLESKKPDTKKDISDAVQELRANTVIFKLPDGREFRPTLPGEGSALTMNNERVVEILRQIERKLPPYSPFATP